MNCHEFLRKIVKFDECHNCLLGNTYQAEVSADISFVSFIRKESYYSQDFFLLPVYWLGLISWLSAPWIEILNFSIENCATEVASWVRASINVFVSSWKSQVKITTLSFVYINLFCHYSQQESLLLGVPEC